MAKKARSLPVAKRDISQQRRKAFLGQLRDHGVVTWAAIASSPHVRDRKGAASSFYALRRRDIGFAAEWDECLEEANDKLIIEARRRAIDGVPKLRTFKDSLIYVTDPETGERRPIVDIEYSDRLMEILLKGGHPDTYVERRLIEHVNKPNSWQITSADLACLSDRESEMLAGIMATIMESRGEIEPDPMLGRAEIEANMKTIEHSPTEIIEIEPTDKELAAIEAEEWKNYA